MRITLALTSAIFTVGCLSQSAKRSYTVDDYMGDPAVAAGELDLAGPGAKQELDLTVLAPQIAPEPLLAEGVEAEVDKSAGGDDLEPTGEGLAALLKDDSRVILDAVNHVEAVRYGSGSEMAKGRGGDQAFARRILGVLFDDKRVADWGGPLCQTFEPSVGLWLKGAKGSAELLLSFRCSELQLRITDASGKVLQVLRADFPEDKGGRQELLSVSQEAFPKEQPH